jgi:DNA-binding MarR family transcriptional regulator
MDGSKLKLENQLCFRLYAASRAMTRLYQPLLKPLNITYPQYLVMLFLWQRPDDGITACSLKELGQALYLDSGTLTPLLRRLEAAGLIARCRNDVDGREMAISLSHKGRELKNEALNIPDQIRLRLNGLANVVDQSTLFFALDRIIEADKV